jgi:hypothetical protein
MLSLPLRKNRAMRRAILISLVFAALPALALAQNSGPSTAQPLSYDLKTLSFDRWCLEDEHFSQARCDERRAEDVTAFDDYRASVERYDLKYQEDRTKENQFEKDVLRRDLNAPPTRPDIVAPSPH